MIRGFRRLLLQPGDLALLVLDHTSQPGDVTPVLAGAGFEGFDLGAGLFAGEAANLFLENAGEVGHSDGGR